MEKNIAEKSPTKIDFSNQQHAIWQALYERQLERVQLHACKDYLAGFQLLEMSSKEIPSIEFLNSKITPRTGWKTLRTHVRYSDAVQWYQHFARQEFLITDYMRSWDELDFTPEPDMFHDIFGHMPFMMHPHYTALQDLFAPAFQRANDEQREMIKRLAWYSTEFGLILEKGEIKIFGAGLMSSSGEIENVIAGNVPIQAFSIENVIGHDKAVWSFNEVLFIIESVDELKKELASYFDTIG
jgi:phenylalanine-4-hydroxylase